MVDWASSYVPPTRDLIHILSLRGFGISETWIWAWLSTIDNFVALSL